MYGFLNTRFSLAFALWKKPGECIRQRVLIYSLPLFTLLVLYLLILAERVPYKMYFLLLTSLMTQVCDAWSSRNIFWLLLYFLFPLPSFLFYSTYLLLSHVCGQRGKKSTQVWMSKLITEYTILQNVWWYLDHKWLLRSKTISMSQIGNITLQSQSVCLVT